MNYLDNTKEELIALLESTEGRYSAIYNQSPIAIELYDSKGNLIQVNESCLALFGIKNIDEINGFSLFSDPNISSENKQHLALGQNIRYQGPFDFEVVKAHKLYSTIREGVIWLDVLITPLKVHETDNGYLVQIQDITEQRVLEDALRKSEMDYRNFYLNAPIGLYRTTPEGRVILANQAIADLLRCSTLEELEGKILDSDNFGPAYNRDDFLDEIHRNGEVKDKEAEWVCSDGSIRIVEENARIIYDSAGKALYFDGSVEDITDRKVTAEALNQALVRAEASDRLKTAFLNNISHEVRTPLNGILGFVELIDDPSLTTEDRELYKDILHVSADRLLDTINSYMDISLLVSGNMQVNQSEFNLIKLLNTGCDDFLDAAAAKGVIINQNYHGINAVLMLNSDRELIRKVYYHLLSNAVKFTEFGTINIDYKILESEVEIIVEDSGIGIREDIRERIFDSFLQADLSNTRKHEGSGLGLAIAKGVIELLGGRIWVKSTEGFGSTFGFSIPGLLLPEPKMEVLEPAKVKAGLDDMVILIVEDDPINIYLLESMLNKSNAQVWHVENGQLAVNFCKNHPEVGIVLMDLKMPVMDGFEATRLIKASRPDLPIIAVTAYAMPGDKELAFEAGCVDYISKPFSSVILQEKLRLYCSI